MDQSKTDVVPEIGRTLQSLGNAYLDVENYSESIKYY